MFINYPARAQDRSNLAQFLGQIPLAEVFPNAAKLGPVEGTPPAAAALDAQGKALGFVFMNSDVVNATGYSGKPIHVAVGMDSTGRIVGAKLLKHSEPIVLIGIPEKRVAEYIAGHVGFNPLQAASTRDRPRVDIVSGATVTVLVIGDTMVRGAIKLARARGLGPYAATPGALAATAAPRTIALDRAGTQNWEELLGNGSVRRLHLSVGDANAAFERAGDPRAAERPERGAPEETFIDLYAAQASVPVIGRSLLGEAGYAALRGRLEEGQSAILVMANGRYSFRGSGFVRGGIFDRIELLQEANAVRFRDRDYERIGDLASPDAPRFAEIGLFVIPKGADFSAVDPWRLQLLVQRQVGALDRVFVTVELPYELPEQHLAARPLPPPPAVAPTAAVAPPAETAQDLDAEDGQSALWQRIWRDRMMDIVILCVGLAVLTGIFFFQNQLTRRPRLTWWVRTLFLAWTLLWLGWWANAQLSVVNILTVANALVTNFSWSYFLMDPMLFILWAAVAAALLFWGRGAFCGWLCPFGALQEFLNMAARRLKVPQLRPSWGLHERLWPLKYIVFLGLFGVSLHSLAQAEVLAEEEPFKTAIILKFDRDWPFVAYVAALLAAGLFVERFYCRYLCPLGAALAIPARLRMFEWLKRHKECGSPCQRCGVECPVQSIHPEGNINPNECINCMHCQTLYWDEQRCPHMIQRRLKRERAQALKPALPHRTAEPPLRQTDDPDNPLVAGGVTTAPPGRTPNSGGT
ncbi:NosR/NirI family protein [Azospirillum sp. TSO22-1]|uniref:NosR/NirI family protein n=1 Tax=Azospirillum sp. TSO22-1 TaxID=716789 RepID=UPI000D617058|nr:NosR/NirI family protein [Azospirillum sp. TSO22-1]PWC38955.1 FMN-binding protein [Azospirillum sp. TSO22-1]